MKKISNFKQTSFLACPSEWVGNLKNGDKVRITQRGSFYDFCINDIQQNFKFNETKIMKFILEDNGYEVEEDLDGIK